MFTVVRLNFFNAPPFACALIISFYLVFANIALRDGSCYHSLTHDNDELDNLTIECRNVDARTIGQIVDKIVFVRKYM